MMGKAAKAGVEGNNTCGLLGLGVGGAHSSEESR